MRMLVVLMPAVLVFALFAIFIVFVHNATWAAELTL
jgi:hypothetical protein